MNKLLEALQKLAELHITLLDTAKKKQEILISAEINPLLAILSDESKLIKRIKEADEQRMEFLGNENISFSLLELIETLPDGDKKAELTSIRNLLKHLFQEIERVNQFNQQLLNQSITYTQYMIEQMLPEFEDSYLYSSKANSQEFRDIYRLFDVKA